MMNGRSGLVIALVAAFFFGCTAGALGGFLASTWVLRSQGPRYHGPPPPGRFEDRVRQDIERRLGLTDDQTRRFHRVLERSRSRYRAVRESTRQELETILTAEQRERFRKLESRYFERRYFVRRHWRGAGPPPSFPQPETEGEEK
jgi:Spy/CpxP family protein refolding chaperone